MIAFLIERRVSPPQWSDVAAPTGVGSFWSDVHRAHRFPNAEAAGEAMRRMSITPEERGEYFVSERIERFQRPSHPLPDREAIARDTSGFDPVAAIIQHMGDDLCFVVGVMPNEDQQRFYRLRDQAREWLIAEGARIDAAEILSLTPSPSGEGKCSCLPFAGQPGDCRVHPDGQG